MKIGLVIKKRKDMRKVMGNQTTIQVIAMMFKISNFPKMQKPLTNIRKICNGPETAEATK